MFDVNSINTTCISCFKQHSESVNPCPECGFDELSIEQTPHLLRPRTILNGKYLVGKVLGQGGFGITYIGYDINLGLKIALKEYYPSGFVTRETTSTSAATVQPFTGSEGEFFLKGREKFINEARALAKFFSLPGIVSVKDYFLENGTAYISMEFIDGQTLKDYVKNMGGKLPAAQVFDLMKPVMSSLAEVHKNGIIHRDISPDNIMISKEGYLKLLDFGAARDFTQAGNKSMSVMLKPGFAPEEQYRTKGEQGPWTDIYALSATMYRCITGVTPEESVERVRKDNVLPPSAMGIPIDSRQETAMMMGMAVLQDNRFQSVTAIFSAIYGSSPGNTPTVTNVPTPVSTAPQQYAAPQQGASYTQVPQGFPSQAPQGFAPTPIKSGSWFSKNKALAGILGGVLLLILTLGIVFLVMFLPGNDGGVDINVSPPPVYTDTPTPAPSPPVSVSSDIDNTTWELFEIYAEGVTLNKDYLDSIGFTATFWFDGSGDSALMFEQDTSFGTWHTSGNDTIVYMDGMTLTLNFDGNLFVWDYEGVGLLTFARNENVIFRLPDAETYTPPPSISDDDERQYHLLKGTWVLQEQRYLGSWLYHFGWSEKIIFFGDGRVYSSGDASDDYADEIWSEWFIEGDVYDNRISVSPSPFFNNTFTYNIRGNVLILTDGAGDDAYYERVSYDSPVGRWALEYDSQHMWFFGTSTTIEFDVNGIATAIDSGRWAYWWFDPSGVETYTSSLVIWDWENDIEHYLSFFITSNGMMLFDTEWAHYANYIRVG